MPLSVAAKPIRVIEPRQPGAVERVREAWQHRTLVIFFARRFVQKQYLRTWLGWLWLPLRPIIDIASRVLIFGGLFGVPSEGIPYAIYLLTASSAWELFDRTAYWSTRSLELNRRFLRRLYVPRLTLLAGALAPGIVNYVMYSVVTIVAMAVTWITSGTLYLDVGPGLLLAVGGIALLLLIAISVGLWLSVYGAQARDVRFVLSYGLSFLYFLTPVLYPLNSLPQQYQTLVQLNPLTAPILLVKKGVLGVGTVPVGALAVSFGFVLVVGSLGLRFFNRSESAALDSL